ncbi:PR domain zinc finger protein 13 [Frankliniella fusca]|uniref:PR domain zinc finger protein 13 n=1 Tax=Frankliniella fusca TaxID=407009 RepID=A0AAE1LCU5_9NEOP|nr:PR domain zinc finger protein 13 [Frankliniella fusca]
MTVGLWGCADSCLAATVVAFPDAVMFPVQYAAARTPPRTARPAPPSSRGSSNCSTASPPSPAVSPLLAAGAGAGAGLTPHGGGYFRLDVATPPPSSRATSTPGPGPGPSPGGARPPRSPGGGSRLPHPRRHAAATPTPSTVVVAEDIPLHAASKTFQPGALLGAAGDPDLLVGDDSLQLRLSAEGHLDVDADPTPGWVRRVRLADDCHSVNVQLQVERHSRAARAGAAGPAGVRCMVRAVRPLSRGQDLLMWFADDLLACLRLPFLAPHNIQGEKRYVCHHCGRTFEFPNPLKLHLALDCGREDVAELWCRLQRLGEEEDADDGRDGYGRRKDTSAFRPYWASVSNTSVDSGVSSLSRLSGSLNGSGGLNGSLNGSLGSSEQAVASPGPAPGPSPATAPASAPGLFGAFHHWALSNPALRPGVPTLPLPLPTLSPAHHHHHPLLPRPLPPPPESLGLGGLLSGHHHGLGATRVRDATPQHAVQAHQASYHQHASDMETLVSNLGRSKQGHLCIYCGKVYSRKYGLKIHIRTHTGFKPLKCKYCLRPFGDPSNLNKHVRLHAEGDTPYKCDLCGKVLVRRRDLERHVKSRHQDGDWDGNDMDTDNDDAEDDVDVEVDVGEETKSNDDDEERERPLHCNGSSLKQGAGLDGRRGGGLEKRLSGAGADIAIPTA